MQKTKHKYKVNKNIHMSPYSDEGISKANIGKKIFKEVYKTWSQIFHFFQKIEVYLTYNLVLISGVQQSDLAMHTYNSLHLPIPNSQSISVWHPLPLASTSLLSMSVSLFLFHK